MFHARIFFVSVLLLGCAADDGTDSGAGTTGTSTSGESTTMATTTTTTGSSATQPTTSTASTSEGESSSTTQPTTSTSDASTGSAESESTTPTEESSGGAGVCSEDPEDDACRTCVKETCCDDWAACRADEACACIVDCHLGGGSLGMCNNQCGGGDSELYQALYFCGQMTCLGTCDWDCC